MQADELELIKRHYPQHEWLANFSFRTVITGDALAILRELAQTRAKLEKTVNALGDIAGMNETFSERSNFDSTPQKRARLAIQTLKETEVSGDE